MTKQNHYCDDPRKEWIVTYNGITFAASLVSTRNAQKMTFPELNLDYAGKEFIIQFDNATDLIAARDSGRVLDINVVNLKRSKRIPGTIIHKQIIS